MNATQQLEIVRLEKLHPSKTNPRSSFDAAKLGELSRSILAQGVVEPLLVRPLDSKGDFEIVCGERRYKAAQIAKLEGVPCTVRELTDAQVLEIQLIENVQREDISALDEGRGYRDLIDKAGYDVPNLAVKIGKSISYVYQRLKLAEVQPSVKKALGEGKITPGHAILLARLQPTDQERGLKDLFNYGGEVASVRDLTSWIKTNIHLNLSAAPWKKDDAGLVEAAGPCTSCPKRSGNNQPLYGEKNANLCMDPGCYKQKLAAHLDVRFAELERAKQNPVKLLTGWSSLKPSADPTILCEGQFRRAVERTCSLSRTGLWMDGPDAGHTTRVCADRGCKVHYADSGMGETSRGRSTSEKKIQKKLALQQRIRERVFHQVLHAAPAKLGDTELRLVAAAFIREMHYDTVKRLGKAWWPELKANWNLDRQLGGRAAKLKGATLASFILSLGLVRELEPDRYYAGAGVSKSPWPNLQAAAKRYRVNVRAIEKAVQAEAQTKTKKLSMPASPAPSRGKERSNDGIHRPSTRRKSRGHASPGSVSHNAKTKRAPKSHTSAKKPPKGGKKR